MNLVTNMNKYSSVKSEMLIKECGGMNAILKCVNDSDVLVRESALQAIGSIARQDANLSQFIVTCGNYFKTYNNHLEHEYNLTLLMI